MVRIYIDQEGKFLIPKDAVLTILREGYTRYMSGTRSIVIGGKQKIVYPSVLQRVKKLAKS